LFEDCLAQSQRVLGDDHLDTLTLLNNLAGLYKSKGEYNRALPLYEDCLAKRQRVLGDDHPFTKGTKEWRNACVLEDFSRI